MLRLHCFSLSGNCFKVAFMLRALGQPFEAVHLDYLNGITRDAQWRDSTNEMGEAPVLEDGALTLSQSGAILIYLADKFGKFGGTNDAERRDILRWILFDNHKFTSYLASYRFMKSFQPGTPDPAVLAWLRMRADAAYAVVDKHLASRDYLVGDGPTIADFSLSGYVFYPVEETGYDLALNFPHVAAWANRLRQLPGWGDPYELMPGGRTPVRAA